ncbi:MAG TPA: thioredoxin domain-containing protein [Tenuifilaceae bacterium]|jgi:thioredoxin-related protein|nr:thioredoxin domain-containing protein [Tenuifilaceae bacterium]
MKLKVKLDRHHLIAYAISLVLVVLIGYKLWRYFTPDSKEAVLQESPEPRPLDIVFGSDTASLPVYMYASYSCTFCRQFFTDVFPMLKKEFLDNGRVKLVMRLLENTNHPDALNSAKTAVCINRYGYFDKLHELLLTDSRVTYTPEFRDMVNDFTARDELVAECILGGQADEYILQIRNEFRKFGLSGTPTFIINRNVYRGYRSYQEFRKIILHHMETEDRKGIN